MPSVGRRLVALWWLAGLSVLGARYADIARADDWEIERRESAAPRKHKAQGKSAQRAPVPGRDVGADAARAQDAQRTRYFELVLRTPSDEAAFERLASLYRARDGRLDGLQADVSARLQAQGDAPSRDGAALWMLQGRIELALGRDDAARSAFENARQRAPSDPNPIALHARLERRSGNLERAGELLAKAAPLASDRELRRQILEELGDLQIERKDFDGARRTFEELVRATERSAFAVTAFARALTARGEHARAAEAYATALRDLAGDARVIAPIRLDQARSELESGNVQAALDTLAKLERESAGEGIRHAASELLLEAHRRAGTLDALAKERGRAHSGDFDDAELLARIHEELGDHAAAERALKLALARRPTHAQTRERLVKLLLLDGRLPEAIEEQQKLVRSAPSEPRYVTSLAQALLEAGRRKEALALLEQTERKHAGDGRVGRALLELYSRWGEHDRARRVLQRLAALEPGDPSYALALGRELLDRGDEAASRAVFARAVERSSDRAAAHAALGEVLLDSDRAEQAVEQFEAALKLEPSVPASVRGLAEALERAKRPIEAEAQWRKLMELGDKSERREARRRIVLLWEQTGVLHVRTRELEAQFGSARGQSNASATPASPAVRPPDLEAGRFLAECYRALAGLGRRGSSDATLVLATERTLERILVLAPGDLEAMLALERSYTARRDIRASSALLEKLLLADPNGSATYLARLAQNALLEYRDSDAIAYAERLVALAPSDAAAHVRLAALYRDRQDVARAVQSYERAIELDPSSYEAIMVLADLLLSTGENARADALLRRALAGSPDDEVVRRAAQALFQIHSGAGTLGALELDLLGLAMRDTRGIYRDLLLELYLGLTQPLLAQMKGEAAQAAAAKAQLVAIGKRAIKPLLQALASGEPGARSVAIDVLGATGNAAALLPLLDAVEQAGDVSLRRRALLAVGAFESDGAAPRLQALATGTETRLRDVAAWALARTASAGGPKAKRALLALTSNDVPAVRGYALLGLARDGGAALIEQALAALEHDRNPWVRGAAALSLGYAGARAQAPQLLAALQVDADEVSACAALALGMLDAHQAEPALAARVFEAGTWSARAAVHALLTFGAPARARDVIVPPTERAALPALLAAYLESAGAPAQPAPAHAALLASAFAAALAGGGPTAKSALRALTQPELRAPSWDDALTREIVVRASHPLLALAARGESDARASALLLLVRFAPGQAVPALTLALSDRLIEVRSAALDAAAALIETQHAEPNAISSEAAEAVGRALAALMAGDSHWPLRQRAAQVVADLARLWSAARMPAREAVLRALEHDSSSFVRQASARAAAMLAGTLEPGPRSDVLAALARSAKLDPETRVRHEASAALDDVGTRPPDVPFR